MYYHKFVPFGTVVEVNRTNIFSGITAEVQANILSAANKVHADKGIDVYKKGCIGILSRGSAKVIRTSSGGNSVTVRTMTDGDIFGAASVFGEWNENFSSIVAVCECDVLYFCECDFKKMIMKYPDFAINYIVFLTDRIRFLNRRLDTFSASTTQNKLYEFLMTQTGENGIVQLKISMSELAKRLNVGRTSLYRDIAALEKANLIQRQGKKFLLNKGD